MNEIIASALAMGLLVVLAGGIHWGTEKIGFPVSWRVSVVVVVLLLMGVGILASIFGGPP